MKDYEKTDWSQKTADDIYDYISDITDNEECVMFFLWLSKHYPNIELSWMEELEDLRSSLPYHEDIALCENFLQDIHPSIFEEYCEQFEFIEMDLCDYYLHTNQPEKLDQRIEFLKQHPFASTGITPERLLFQLLYSGQYDKAIDLCKAVWKPLLESEELVGNPEYNFINVLYLDGIQKVWLSDSKERKQHYTEVFAAAVEMGFDNEPEQFSRVIDALESEFDKATLSTDISNDLGKIITVLNVHFMKYMWNTWKIPFMVSDFLWRTICVNELYDRALGIEKLFYFSPAKLEKHCLSKLNGFDIDTQIELFGKVYGLQYVYEFINSIELIHRDDYIKMLENLVWLRIKAIEKVKGNIWQMQFVSTWPENELWPEIKQLSENTFGREKSQADTYVMDYCKNIPFAFRIKAELNKTMFSKPDSLIDSVPYVKQIPNVGRNEPCPCGSGKKYKNCCLKG